MNERIIGFLIGAFCVFMAAGCSTFSKEPIFPASQYTPGKLEHGLVLTRIGQPRWLPGTAISWLEQCDYTIDRKEGEPYVLFPTYVYTNCTKYGTSHLH